MSRNIAHFMDSESSLPVHVRLPVVPFLSQVTPVHVLKPISLRSILTLSCNLWLGHISLFPSGFPSIFLYAPHLSPIHATCPLYHIWFVDIYNMWWVQIIKVCIMQSSPVSCFLIPIRPKYLPQHPILKHT